MSGRAFKDLRPKMQRTGQWQDRVDGKNFAGETPDQAAKRKLADRKAEDRAELADEKARDQVQAPLETPKRSTSGGPIARDERDVADPREDGEP